MPSTNLYWKSHLLKYYEIKFPHGMVNEVNGTNMIGSSDLNFILTKHQGILYADIVTNFSIEVDSLGLFTYISKYNAYLST